MDLLSVRLSVFVSILAFRRIVVEHVHGAGTCLGQILCSGPGDRGIYSNLAFYLDSLWMHLKLGVSRLCDLWCFMVYLCIHYLRSVCYDIWVIRSLGHLYVHKFYSSVVLVRFKCRIQLKFIKPVLGVHSVYARAQQTC